MSDFKAGDYVKYGASGVCLIEGMKTMELKPGDKKEFYILKPVQNKSSTLYVPIGNDALRSKMRYILTKDQIDSIILSCKNDKEFEWIEDRKERNESFKKILSGGDVSQLLKLVSVIYLKRRQLKSENKKISSFDEEILSKAQQLIDNEFSFSLEISGEQVGEYIRKILEK